MIDLKGKGRWELSSKKPDREDFIQVIKVTTPGKNTQLQDALVIQCPRGPSYRICGTFV